MSEENALEKFHEIIRELNREYKCTYVKNYNLMNKIKAKGKWDE